VINGRMKNITALLKQARLLQEQHKRYKNQSPLRLARKISPLRSPSRSPARHTPELDRSGKFKNISNPIQHYRKNSVNSSMEKLNFILKRTGDTSNDPE